MYYIQYSPYKRGEPLHYGIMDPNPKYDRGQLVSQSLLAWWLGGPLGGPRLGSHDPKFQSLQVGSLN